MKAYILLATVAVLVVVVLALLGMWSQIGDALRSTFLNV